ncbi:MAG TPA: 16S rRNA (guanine(527)-N(7))-methyltransferase RsmG [Marinilabiliaceae bacterium]|nr:16S rRNA (guanine(527)-N(7))-methyltransferase RsmG [Marinilabiliaceae bacterium]
MELILKYFKNLTDLQKNQFEQLQSIYSEWNRQINVISRKDMEHFYERHVLHSLGIANFINFAPQTRIIDVGTGGGFPGIPLAILFPEVSFTLIDSIGKKIKVVNAVIDHLELKNTKALQTRAEEFKESYDFIVSRAVTRLPDFFRQTKHLISTQQRNAITNGILYLKGGDLTEELQPFKNKVIVDELSEAFEEPFFITKKIVHLPF